MADLSSVLIANGLGAFADTFLAEQVTLETVVDLVEEDLKVALNDTEVCQALLTRLCPHFPNTKRVLEFRWDRERSF